MTQQNGKAKEISLGEGFGDVAVKVNGVRVQVDTNGSIQAYTNGTVRVSPIANDDGKAVTSPVPKVGDKMLDGTVFAGISPETSKPMYATPADAPLTRMFNKARTFNKAQKYAAKLNAHGHKDWRVPTKAELNVLFNNRAAIGGFNSTGSPPPAGTGPRRPFTLVMRGARASATGICTKATRTCAWPCVASAEWSSGDGSFSHSTLIGRA